MTEKIGILDEDFSQDVLATYAGSSDLQSAVPDSSDADRTRCAHEP